MKKILAGLGVLVMCGAWVVPAYGAGFRIERSK